MLAILACILYWSGRRKHSLGYCHTIGGKEREWGVVTALMGLTTRSTYDQTMVRTEFEVMVVEAIATTSIIPKVAAVAHCRYMDALAMKVQVSA
jgi:hypothetical protein